MKITKSGDVGGHNATQQQINTTLRKWGLDGYSNEDLLKFARSLGSQGVSVNCDLWCKGTSEGVLDPEDFPELSGLKEVPVRIEVKGCNVQLIIARIYLFWKEAFEEWSYQKLQNFPGQYKK